MAWSSGRKVTMQPAMIPIPGSTVDQMVTSTVFPIEYKYLGSRKRRKQRNTKSKEDKLEILRKHTFLG
jgi:hypothetical protein